MDATVRDLPSRHVLIVAADHPSLDDAVERFADDLRAEPRRFGPSAAANPKPFPSLVARVCGPGGGFRLAAVDDGRVVGLARVDGAGELLIVVAADRRGQGVGGALAAAVVDRARVTGYHRLVLRSTRRSRAVARLGAALGVVVVDLGRGRVDLIVELSADTSSA